jgi:hypothetical protein
MVNDVMDKLFSLHDEDVPSTSKKAARRPTLSVAVQRLGVLFWVLLCVAFWIGVARLVF